MKNSRLSIAKVIIFVFGLGVLAVIFSLLAPIFDEKQEAYIFACACVSLVYLAIFLPLMLVSARGGIVSAFASGAVYYKGLAGFITVSLAAAVLALTILPLGIAIAAECIALFILLICVFASAFAKEHIENVQVNENIKKSVVEQLRSRAGRLKAKAAVLDPHSSVRIAAEKIAEDMRYLSPSDSPDAQDIERRMLAALDAILMDSFFVSGGSGSAEVIEGKLSLFDDLYRERKSIY